jgi:hypothetical protein
VQKQGIKHLIKCRCILPTMKRLSDPPAHSFVVFSVVGEDGVMIPKKASCNNCGIMHEVIEACTSKIITSAEGSASEMSLEDVAVFLPESVRNVLSSYNLELPDYEYVRFMIEEDKVGEWLILGSELNDTRRSGKILKYKGDNRFEVEPFSREEFFGNSK